MAVVRRWLALWTLPPGRFARELRLFAQIAAPSVVIQMAQFTIMVLNAAFVGRLCGEEALGGVALANLSGNLTGMMIIYGMLSALDTLAPQEYGAGRHAEVGLLAQRGAGCCAAAVTPALGLWLFGMAPLLRATGQPAAVSAMAVRFLRVFAFCLPPIIAFECARRFLATQAIVRPVAVVTVAAALVLHPLLLWLLLGVSEVCGAEGEVADRRGPGEGAAWLDLGSGVEGGVARVALATVATNVSMAAALIGYIWRYQPHHPATWPGWQWRKAMFGGGGGGGAGKGAGARQPTLVFLRLGLPGILAQSEWWFWEAVCFMAGSVGSAALAAHTVAYEVIPFCFMLMFGLSFGLSTRCGVLLGQGGESVRVARALALRVAVVSAVGGTAVAAVVYAGRDALAGLFLRGGGNGAGGAAAGAAGNTTGASGSAAETGAETARAVRAIWALVSVMVVFDGCFAINMGIIRALGLQMRQTVAVAVALWGVGMPCLYNAGFGFGAAARGAVRAQSQAARLAAMWTYMPVVYVLLNGMLIAAYATKDWDQVSRAVRQRRDGGAGDAMQSAATEAVEGASEGGEIPGKYAAAALVVSPVHSAAAGHVSVRNAPSQAIVM